MPGGRSPILAKPRRSCFSWEATPSSSWQIVTNADGAVDGTTKMLANFVQPPLVLTLNLNLGSDVHRNVCGYEMIGYDHRYPKGAWSFGCEGRGKLHSYSVAQSGDPFVSEIASFFFGDDDVTGTNGACSTFPSAKYPDCASRRTQTERSVSCKKGRVPVRRRTETGAERCACVLERDEGLGATYENCTVSESGRTSCVLG